MQIDGAAATPDRSAHAYEPRLVKAAYEFEAQMMKELLKPMTGGATIGGDDSDSGSGGALNDFATEALGQSLSRGGGLGLANSILQSLSLHGTDAGPGPDSVGRMHVSDGKFSSNSREVKVCR